MFWLGVCPRTDAPNSDPLIRYLIITQGDKAGLVLGHVVTDVQESLRYASPAQYHLVDTKAKPCGEQYATSDVYKGTLTWTPIYYTYGLNPSSIR